LRHDFEAFVLILKWLTSKRYPVGYQNFSFNYFLFSDLAEAWSRLGKGPAPAHELSMRRKAEMIGKEGGKKMWVGMKGMGWVGM